MKSLSIKTAEIEDCAWIEAVYLQSELDSGVARVKPIPVIRVMQQEHVSIILGISDKKPVGALLLITYSTLTNSRGVIEDLLVVPDSRRQGVGRALVCYALEVARACACDYVDLTSRPSREQANELYVRVGFTKRETNVYRYRLI